MGGSGFGDASASDWSGSETSGASAGATVTGGETVADGVTRFAHPVPRHPTTLMIRKLAAAGLYNHGGRPPNEITLV
jgi:hypothetical protein